ncbi:MAG: lipopolysaccharide assembly protein LapB, partial [Rubrivivax sp.]|nr:lipopolysaccharide assembly protein LapB [Rubrivivax sp.]
ADAGGRPDDADAQLQIAGAAAPQAARPRVLAGQRLRRRGEHRAALKAWDSLQQDQPAAFALVAADYADSALACGQRDAAHAALSALLALQPGIDLLRALARLDAAPSDAGPRLQAHLHQHPTLSAAQDLLALPAADWPAGAVADLQQALARAARPLQRYRCAACGFEAQHWFWQCPGCLGWDSFPPQRIEEL